MNVIQMRPSRVLSKLRSGEVATCFKLNLADARAAEIAALAGFDCLWTDLEHVPNDLGVIEKIVLAGKSQNTDVLVRVARGGSSDYIRPLEMDAAGIMVPHCMSLSDAREIVRITRFHPLGLRPLDGGNADGAYCGVDLQRYLVEANAQRMLVLQIEDPEPLDELDAIAAVPGIDMLFFGPGDFSQAIGAPGVWDHPRLIEARRRVAEAATAAGKFAGTVGSAANLEELISLGYRFISIGADVVGLAHYCRSIMKTFGAAPQSSGGQIYKA